MVSSCFDFSFSAPRELFGGPHCVEAFPRHYPFLSAVDLSMTSFQPLLTLFLAVDRDAVKYFRLPLPDSGVGFLRFVGAIFPFLISYLFGRYPSATVCPPETPLLLDGLGSSRRALLPAGSRHLRLFLLFW